MRRRLTIFTMLMICACQCNAQTDSSAPTLKEIPLKYLGQVSAKAVKYSSCISSKTEKTLAKLTKWENKIHSMLEKANPATAERLFGEGRITFAVMLQKVKAGRAVADNYRSQYDSYTDKLSTGLQYLETKKDSLDTKYVKPLAEAKTDMQKLDKDVAESEAVTKLIKERKKQLIDESLKYLGKSKYLKRINKESFYYAESLRNYKEVFNDPQKTEKLAIDILNKIPAFKKFASKNSLLSKLFGGSTAQAASGTSIPVVNGLTSRSQIMQSFQSTAGNTGNFNPFKKIEGQIPDIKNKMDDLLNLEKPESQTPKFKYNSQRTKPFFKRLEFSSDLQFESASNISPTKAKVGLQVGYKLDDKRSFGIGASYILGLGYGWKNISLSNEGLGARSYVKMLLKKGFNIQGGSELNYNFSFNKLSALALKNNSNWQQSALLGIGKSYKAGKMLKGDIKLFFDFLYNTHLPVTQPFIFRMGYHL